METIYLPLTLSSLRPHNRKYHQLSAVFLPKSHSNPTLVAILLLSNLQIFLNHYSKMVSWVASTGVNPLQLCWFLLVSFLEWFSSPLWRWHLSLCGLGKDACLKPNHPHSTAVRSVSFHSLSVMKSRLRDFSLVLCFQLYSLRGLCDSPLWMTENLCISLLHLSVLTCTFYSGKYLFVSKSNYFQEKLNPKLNCFWHIGSSFFKKWNLKNNHLCLFFHK